MLYGRLDSQVKIEGHRVELGEIEYYARTFLKGSNTVAFGLTNDIGNTEIVLIIEGPEYDTIKLIEYLKSKIPYYMTPTKIIFRDKFPLNANGKVDKLKLKETL